MQSAFYNVSLDRIRYSLVWEDSHTLYAGLQIGAQDHVLVISSAGCNVLNALLKCPASLTAIDLNPLQNRLLLLKKHIVLHHDYPVFRGLLGLDGPARVAQSWEALQHTLPPAELPYWKSFFHSHPEGLLASGKLESYIHGFYHTLSTNLQEKLQALICFEEVSAQHTFFQNELHPSSFREQFLCYFDDAHLSKGRDPSLFTYATEAAGPAFYKRLQAQLASRLVKDNFYFRFFFFGPEHLPARLLPPCYQEAYYNRLRGQLHKLQVVRGEAVDYLLSEAGAGINKASLSNIFEYTSPAAFEQAYTALFADARRQLRIIFWNLLQQQGASLGHDRWHDAALSASLSRSDGCFYFCNVRVQQTCPPPATPVNVPSL